MVADTDTSREPFAFLRLLIRSALLGLLVPVAQGDFWYVKAALAVAALVVCLVLYALEKAFLLLLRNRPNVKPTYRAACRGAVLYSLLTFAMTGDWATALGAAIGGALAAMFLFIVEGGIVRLFATQKDAASAPKV